MLKSFGQGLAVVATVSLLAVGCDTGGRDGSGSNIPNIGFSATFLAVDNAIYQTSDMNRARYSHTATLLEDGRVLVVGGTDEAHLNTLDSAEIYDQSSLLDLPPLPETGSGVWFENDFEGEPMALNNGGRIFHTANRLPSGNVLIAGGTADILVAPTQDASEIFETQTRLFDPPNLEIVDDMVEPRFRHAAIPQPSGRILFIGGQIALTEVIIDPDVPAGFPGFMTTVQIFPSTTAIEEYDPAQRAFSLVTNQANDVAELVTPRGRYGHASGAVAGPDLNLGTGDDVILTVGGTETLSGIFAPDTKFWGDSLYNALTSVEYFDPVSGTNAAAPAILGVARNNGVIATNLASKIPNGEAPNGSEGVGNLLLISGGDDDNDVQTSQATSLLISTTFSGAGPVGGIMFATIPGAGLGGIPASYTDIVALRNNLRFLGQDETVTTTWFFSIGGVFLFPTPAGGQAQDFATPAVGRYFDPFWDVGLPMDPWDLTQNETIQNPTGVIGSWFLAIPDSDGSQLPAPPTLTQARCFHTQSVIPGVDGAINTLDDRVLIAGGGDSYVPGFGGEAVNRSAVVYLPHGASN